MPIFIQDVEDRRIGTGTAVPYTQDEFPSNFPLARWNLQLDRYIQYWNAFTGLWLTETMPDEVDDKGVPILRYPLQINYIKKACMVHSYALFGEVNDTPGPLAPIRIRPRFKPGAKGPEDDARIRAEELEDFINRVWIDNNGRSMQQDAGLVQQFLGGIVFRISWQPQDEDLEFGIRLEYVLPDFFLPVWDTGKPDDLYEAWVVYRMPGREANLKFGMPLQDNQYSPLYIEHWTRDKVTITLNGEPLSWTIDGHKFVFNNMDNPFGYVPFVYIPRERAGSYYGLSLVDDVIELSKEMNARIADNSDIIEETSHRNVFMRNVTVSPTSKDIGGSRPVINIGVTPPGGETPDVFSVDPPPLNEAMVKHVEYLRMQFGRDMFVPGVAEGEDEGSQRSALTLAFRMWPLTSKLTAVRTYWTTGLIILGKRIAKMAILKGVGGITQAHLKDIDWGVDWAPMIPRDREADLNEATIGVQSNIITPEDANRILNLTADPARTAEEVKEWMQFVAQVAATAKAQQQSNVNVQTKTQQVATIMKEPGEQ